VLVLVHVLVMALPAVASASSDATSPSLDQYVESVPTATGDRPEPGASGSQGGLPSSTERDIAQQGGSDAPALEAVAGSPALGAPPASSNGGKGARPGAGNGRSAVPPATAAPSALDAATTAASGDDAGAAPWLLAGMLLLTAVAAGVALARRRA
jgi:hypothetical protein